MKVYYRDYESLPLNIKRFKDISAEPLFACYKRKSGIFKYFFKKRETVHRKWSKKNTIKCLFIILPIIVMFILTGGICISVNEKKDVFAKAPKEIQKNFILEEKNNKNNLLLVNAKHPIPKDYKPTLSNYMGIKCDKDLTESLDAMLKAAKDDGYDLEPFNGFIDRQTNENNYNKKVEQLIGEGYTIVRAEAMAEKLVSSPGKCEYETGLIIDIRAKNKNEEDFSSSAEFKWLINNCVEYGFVQRYPIGKEDKTSKNSSPFAFRFVGVENAKKMRTLSMCLEEYVKYLRV